MNCPVNVFSNIVDFGLMGKFFDDYSYWKIDLYDSEKGFTFSIDVYIIVDSNTKMVHPKLRDEVIFDKKISDGELVSIDDQLYRSLNIKIESKGFTDCLDISQKVLNNINIQLLKALCKSEVATEKVV
jgi:hypothetical protein